LGLSLAKGEYIAFLDHDDEWLPEKLRKQVDILENDPSIGFLSCEAIVIDKTGKVIGNATIPNIPENGELFPDLLHTNFMFSNSSLLIRGSVIDHCGPRDESTEVGIAEDREYELRVAAAGYKFYVIHEPLFRYRMHKKNNSRKKQVRSIKLLSRQLQIY
jgi:GT2 family glycosyltransferase